MSENKDVKIWRVAQIFQRRNRKVRKCDWCQRTIKRKTWYVNLKGQVYNGRYYNLYYHHACWKEIQHFYEFEGMVFDPYKFVPGPRGYDPPPEYSKGHRYVTDKTGKRRRRLWSFDNPDDTGDHIKS